jgi:hypothetical protein
MPKIFFEPGSGKIKSCLPHECRLFGWLRFGGGFGDDQEDVTISDDHNGRKVMLHDFNTGGGSIGLGVAHAGMPRSFFFRAQWFF